MAILLAVPFANDKVHCINEFFLGLRRLTLKPDRALFVMDMGETHAKTSWVVKKAAQVYVPDIPIDVKFIPPHADHLEAIGVARNTVLAEARKQPDVSHVWFLDADIVCAPHALQELLKHNNGISGALVATREAPHPFSNRSSRFNVYVKEIQGEKTVYAIRRNFRVGDVLDVDCTGNDCMLICHALFAQQDYRWKLDPPRIGEDFAYCLDAKEKGFSVTIVTSVWVDHFSPIEVFSSRHGQLSRKWRAGDGFAVAANQRTHDCQNGQLCMTAQERPEKR